MLVVVLLAATTAVAGYSSAQTVAQTSQPGDVISWQSAGDSHASGTGIGDAQGACFQSHNAYGPAAARIVNGAGWRIGSETLTACQGRHTEDLFNPRAGSGGSLWDWGRQQGGPERVDVLTLSFGADDVGFGQFVRGCIRRAGGFFDFLNFVGCEWREEELKGRIDALLDPPRRNCAGTRVERGDLYDCDLDLGSRRGSIIDLFYDIVQQRLTEQGHLYVVGYPQLFAPPGEWPAHVQASCQEVPRRAAETLNRVAQHFDEKLREAVDRANQALGDRVRFISLSDLYRSGGHELCGPGDDWLHRPLDGPISWQSTGDSYASGTGIDDAQGACLHSQNAYGPAAARIVKATGWRTSSETFTACHGHLTEDLFNPRTGSGGSLWDWSRQQGGPERVDVLTLSSGGNDIGFPHVMFRCIIGGCRFLPEEELRGRIDALLDPPRSCTGTRVGRIDRYDCDLDLGSRRGSIIDLYYDIVQQRLTERGHLYVIGYPRLFAPPDEWPRPGMPDFSRNCEKVTTGSAEKLNSVGDHFDEKLREAVDRANEALGDRVRYISLTDLYRSGNHELCGEGEDWLHGIIDADLFRGAKRSFHPKIQGHQHTARTLAQRVLQDLNEFSRQQDTPFHPNAQAHQHTAQALAQRVLQDLNNRSAPPPTPRMIGRSGSLGAATPAAAPTARRVRPAGIFATSTSAPGNSPRTRWNAGPTVSRAGSDSGPEKRPPAATTGEQKQPKS